MAQETIIYDGSNPSILQSVTIPVPSFRTYTYSLAPANSSSGASNSLAGNSITVSNGTMDAVFGAFNSMNLGNVTANSVINNNVVINGGMLNGVCYGGWTRYGDADNNKVTMTGGDVGQNLYGGYSYSGNAVNNAVTMGGGRALGGISGGVSNSGIAMGNCVRINGDADVHGDVIGGAVYNTPTPMLMLLNGNGEEISVNVNDAAGNCVNINGGTVKGNIYGGWSNYGNSIGNSVTISGGSVQGNIFGGVSYSGTATDNTVTISGTPDLSTSVLIGGQTNYGGDAFTGNTLNLHTGEVGNQGLAVSGLQNFQYLNFFLPSTMGNGGVMLNVNGQADITDSVVNVGVEGASSPLRSRDHVVLIRTPGAGDLVGTPVNTTADGQGMQGVTLRYLFDIEVKGNSDNELWAILRDIGVNPETEALSNGFLSGVSLLNQTGDLVAGQGLMNKAMCAAKSCRQPCMPAWYRDYGIFCDLAGGWSRYNTGSHADMSGLSLVAGLSWCASLKSAPLTLGTFFEYGNGSYDTFNSFNNAASIRGDGNLHHFGGGILGRMDFRNHFYADASFRAGQINNGYLSGDLRDALGRAASYDSASPYYGLHVGGGKVWNITNHSTLDLYGKYLWTQQQGDFVTLSTGDPVDFQTVNSHRVRFGGRLTGGADETFKPYIGAAWEHEFDGAARATTNGYAIGVPSLRGDTGIGELGVTWKPAVFRGFLVDLGVQGYVGKREGATANLALARNF
ncbi:MAG: autotransporter outer membrane beta-barrel domain-containing protein [Planctomycetaceae bacterium]|nr:autotransporter outer membrane beta-barrel domain-containing protein [Planctomycetaceae bacterium]